jgi:hypothetical protein
VTHPGTRDLPFSVKRDQLNEQNKQKAAMDGHGEWFLYGYAGRILLGSGNSEEGNKEA